MRCSPLSAAPLLLLLNIFEGKEPPGFMPFSCHKEPLRRLRACRYIPAAVATFKFLGSPWNRQSTGRELLLTTVTNCPSTVSLLGRDVGVGKRRVLLPVWTILWVQYRPFITCLINTWLLLLPEDGDAYSACDTILANAVGVTEPMHLDLPPLFQQQARLVCWCSWLSGQCWCANSFLKASFYPQIVFHFGTKFR